MYPALNADGVDSRDRIFVNKFQKGDINDIVVVHIANQANWSKVPEGDYAVKRLVGKAGDRIKIVKVDNNNYNLLVNDNLLYSKNLTSLASTYNSFVDYVNTNAYDENRVVDGAVVVQENEVSVLGDNWETSYDCSSCGPINKDSIVGRVDIIVPESNNLVWGAIKGVFKLLF